MQSLGVKLVDIIKNNNKFKIHTNGEISIQNQKLKNSNINDLLSDVLRDRKTEIPPHGEKFIRFLSEINLPQTFIKNKKRLKLYKKNLDESSDISKPIAFKVPRNIKPIAFKVPRDSSATYVKVPRKKRKVEDFRFLNSDL